MNLDVQDLDLHSEVDTLYAELAHLEAIIKFK